jgi:hypothetical protein
VRSDRDRLFWSRVPFRVAEKLEFFEEFEPLPSRRK